jgi:hypothetical protein
MKELESPSKPTSTTSKAAPPVAHSATVLQLRAMTTDELVKMLMSAEMTRPMNAALREQIIKILQEREGNAFVQRLLGKSSKR